MNVMRNHIIFPRFFAYKTKGHTHLYRYTIIHVRKSILDIQLEGHLLCEFA